MKIDSKKINNLTWRLEIIREQYIFIRADIKKLISANLNNNNIGIAIKLIELSNQLFDVGLNNYRKILKSMCLIRFFHRIWLMIIQSSLLTQQEDL